MAAAAAAWRRRRPLGRDSEGDGGGGGAAAAVTRRQHVEMGAERGPASGGRRTPGTRSGGGDRRPEIRPAWTRPGRLTGCYGSGQWIRVMPV